MREIAGENEAEEMKRLFDDHEHGEQEAAAKKISINKYSIIWLLRLSPPIPHSQTTNTFRLDKIEPFIIYKTAYLAAQKAARWSNRVWRDGIICWPRSISILRP